MKPTQKPDIRKSDILWMVIAVILPIMATLAPIKKNPPFSGARSRETVGLYEGYMTPEWILKGIARTESGERDRSIGDDGVSKGRMQINERFRAERVAKWGRYDPFLPLDAVRIASCVFQENLDYFDNEYLAIAAYQKGRRGVVINGPDPRYVKNVKNKGKMK